MSIDIDQKTPGELSRSEATRREGTNEHRPFDILE